MINNNVARKDDVSKYYKPVKICDFSTTLLFWGISTLLLFFFIFPSWCLFSQNCIRALQNILIVIHCVLSSLISLWLFPRAEEKRRKQLLTDSFGVPLIDEDTSLYYNNVISPSIRRLAANTMENTFFSEKIAAKMLISKRVISISYLAFWLVVVYLRESDMNFISWITQVAFSGEVLLKWLRVEFFRCRALEAYNKLHDYFSSSPETVSKYHEAAIMDAFVTYECAKASSSVVLSSRLFNRLNSVLSEEWKKICNKLGMDLES